MAENRTKVSVSSPLELPRKIGFHRNFWEYIETAQNTVIYAKYGSGDEEILVLIDQLKNTDPGLKVEVSGRKALLRFSKEYTFSFINMKRRPVALKNRESKRLTYLKEAIVDAFSGEGHLSDEEFEQKVAEFPKVVKYYSEEDEEYWGKRKVL